MSKKNFQTYGGNSAEGLKIFSDLRRNFPRKSEKEIFAMIAFQFAFDFYEQAEQMNKALRAVEILDEDLGTLIGADENKPK